MLKQSPSRNQRSKGLKVNHVLQICLLVGLCIWLLNQLKHSHDQNFAAGNSTEMEQSHLEILSLGRKGLRPQGDDGEMEEETDEIKSEDAEDEGRSGGDDEIDGRDQDRAEDEEEAEEIEDLIDVDDRDSSDEIQEKGNQLEDQSSQGKNKIR